jgi:arylsulfatase A-like enzyme
MKRAGFVGGITIVVAAAIFFVWRLIPTTPPDILIITIDTLRADVLEPYGATDTKPAHASILTGLYPDQHGVLKNRQILSEDFVTLAELLRDAGYQTAGFTGIRFLNKRSGLEQGFTDFEAPEGKTKTPRADKVVRRAITWLKAADPEAPVLMWVHVYDPHQPYNPPKPYREGIDSDLTERFPLVGWKSLNRESKRNGGDVPSEVVDLAMDYYRREVEYTDFWIGRLLDSFDRFRDQRRSMVMLTADHGECFENGNYFEHSDCLYEGALRVPLIVRYPKRAGAGLRVGRRVSNVDVFPTVLYELSMPQQENNAGIPLQLDFSDTEARHVLIRVPEIANPNRTPFRLRVIRSVAGEAIAPATDPRTRGVVDLEWKYLWTPDAEQLFNLPDERLDLASTDTENRARMLEALKAEGLKFPPVGSAKEDMDPETLEALEALGYVQ